MFKTPSYSMPKPPKIKMPEMPAMPNFDTTAVTPPPMPEAPPPPPERVDVSSDAAAQQAREEAIRRQGVRTTLMAGETGGYSNPVTGQSLLGQ
jgi:hypothetical protein